MTRLTFARALGVSLLTAATGAALATALPVTASAQGAASTVLGGYRPVATDGEIVQEAAAALAAQIGGELASVDSAQSGGLSYRLEITLADGARWSGTVGIRLPGRNYEVSGQPIQLSPPPGEGDEVDTGSNQAPDDDNGAARR